MVKQIIEEILHPDREFAPIPFWFLNDELSDEEIVRQLTDFCDKGVYGVVLHPRIGIPESIPYLSDRFMHHIRVATETAARLGMYVVLYDEAMYPSGSAHGMVVAENPRFAAQAIILTDDPTEGKVIAESDGKYILQVDSRGTIRGIHFGEDDGEENAPPAADLLSRESVECFIRLTHRRYLDTVGEFFGNTVIGFFTDEPSVLGRMARRGCYPWTWGFEEDFVAAGGSLAELFGLFTGEENRSTALYRGMIFERENEVYYGSLSRFCREHGIALMGHPHSGDDIECERHFDIPGQDMVLRWIAPEGDPLGGAESAQGKCSSDAARIAGKRRNSNECFGVCVRDNIPWYFTGADMKWYIDHLAVRGVNMFIPHAFYYSVRGKRKDERPPDVGPNNIWWRHYGRIADYIKRVSYIMTDSVNGAEVAVMCNNRDMRVDRVRELYRNQVEFNYIPYANLRAEMVSDGVLTVGENRYKYVMCDDECRITGVRHIDGIADIPHRDIYTEIPCPDLRASRLTKRGVGMIFLTNEGDAEIKTAASIDGEVSLVAFDLWRGEYYRLPSLAGDGVTRFDLSLMPRESLLLIFDGGKLAAPMRAERRFLNVNFSLVDEDKENFVKTYRGVFVGDGCAEADAEPWISVSAEEMVECHVNGRFVDVSLWDRHEFNLAGYLTGGVNEITLTVTGNAANRYTDHRIEYGLT